MTQTKSSQGISLKAVTNILLSVFVMLLLMNTCTNMSVSRKVDKLSIEMYAHDSANVEKMETDILKNNKSLREGLNIDLNRTLYNFLIYEYDLDKNKISLSKIKTLLLNDENNRENNENDTE